MTAALSLGVTSLVAGSNVAYASHAGTTGVLTSLNGGTAVHIQGSSDMATSETNLRYPAWSADGSRLFFVGAADAIESVRFNDGTDAIDHADLGDAAARRNVTVDSSGSFLAWAEQATAANGGLWSIMQGSVDGGLGGPIASDPGVDYTHPDAGPDETLVYQKTPHAGGTSEVWGYTSSSQIDPALLVSDAASPAISPDGQQLAWIRSTGGHTQVFASDLSGGSLVQVTSDATDHDNPTWSPDGATIAFNEGSAVLTAASDGSQAAAPVTVAGLTGVPAYRPANKNNVVRLSGPNRFATAIAVSQSHWATAGASGDTRPAAKSVVLSRSDTYADALGGGALAAAKGGPLLMTPTAALDPTIKAEIQRVLGNNPSATVYLLGNEGALSASVNNAVLAMGYNVSRLAGSNRFATSVEIAKAINPHPDNILVATGMNFPDALGAGAAAGSLDLPGSGTSAVVVLTNDSTLPADTKTFLDGNPNSTMWGIGGQGFAAIDGKYNDVVDMSGAGICPKTSRYCTSWLTAEVFFGGVAPTVGLATSLNWPDALAGGALQAALSGPVLISAPTGFDPLISSFYLDFFSTSISTVNVFGSAGSVPDSIANGAGTLISGPAGFNTASNPTTMALLAPGAKPFGAKIAAPKANTRTLKQMRATLTQLQK